MKKILCLILAILMSVSFITAFAADATVEVDGVTFSKDKKTLIKYASAGGRTTYDIPKGVTTIAEDAFKNCKVLKKITMPDSVTKIGKFAFSFCTSLEEITLSKNLTEITESIFDNCTALLSVEIPENVTSIGAYAFNQCKKLKSVSIPKSVTLIDTGAFSRCQSLAEINYSGTQNDWAKIQIKNANQSLTNATLIAEKSDEVIITLDGKPLDGGNIDQPPIIEQGRTLVPLRAIFEALGADVTWEDETQTVGATKGDTVISLQIGSTEMKINDVVKTLDVPAKLVNSRTLVPVRAVAEAFGCKVGWDGVTNTVIIETKK